MSVVLFGSVQWRLCCKLFSVFLSQVPRHVKQLWNGALHNRKSSVVVVVVLVDFPQIWIRTRKRAEKLQKPGHGNNPPN